MNDLLDNRLPVLAGEVQAAHRQVTEAAGAAVIAARTAGAALIEAKGRLPHGAWLPWLREIGVKPRTAQAYMQLAALDGPNAQRVAHLTLRRALRSVAKAEFSLPELDQFVWGSAGPPLKEFEHSWHELEAAIWRSSRWPGFYWLLCWIGSEVISSRKPEPDPYGYLEYLGFPVAAGDWQIYHSPDPWLARMRHHLFGPYGEPNWFWHDEPPRAAQQ